LSALAFCKDVTAQIAAGIQPIKVICRIRQSMAVKIRPLKKKESDGKKIAMSVMCFDFNKNNKKGLRDDYLIIV
jgi:hypothetical protein